MKRIGLIGGLAWPSTEVYHRLLNEEVARRLGPEHSAVLVIRSDDFADVAAMQREGRWDEAAALLAASARALVAAGAEVVAIGANTMHLVADDVAAAVDVPLVHVVDAVLGEAELVGASRLGLLATSYTARSRLYPDRAEARWMDVLVPHDDRQEELQRVIYEELTRGTVSEAARSTVLADAADLVERGADAVVLGCTELSLVLRDGDLSVPVLDSTALHVRAMVDAAL